MFHRFCLVVENLAIPARTFLSKIFFKNWHAVVTVRWSKGLCHNLGSNPTTAKFCLYKNIWIYLSTMNQ